MLSIVIYGDRRDCECFPQDSDFVPSLVDIASSELTLVATPGSGMCSIDEGCTIIERSSKRQS